MATKNDVKDLKAVLARLQAIATAIEAKANDTASDDEVAVLVNSIEAYVAKIDASLAK